MINVRLAIGANSAKICEAMPVQKSIQQAEKSLAENGRVLLRASGTEPVIRVMVEGQDADLVDSCCKQISEVVAAQV